MNTPPILIKAIAQKDNHTFSIQWSDGSTQDYRLSDLQQACPCAKCHQMRLESREKLPVDPEVKAIRITSVGRYALRIKFTSGCSNGIYSYSMLKALLSIPQPVELSLQTKGDLQLQAGINDGGSKTC